MPQRMPSEASASIKKSSSAPYMVDDLSSIFGGNVLLMCLSFPAWLILLVSLLKPNHLNFCLQKLPHYLGNFRKLKEKVKKDEEPDSAVIVGLKIARCVFTLILSIHFSSLGDTTFYVLGWMSLISLSVLIC